MQSNYMVTEMSERQREGSKREADGIVVSPDRRNP